MSEINSTHGTLDAGYAFPAGRCLDCHMISAAVKHVFDRRALETVGTFGAGDGVLEWEEGERAFEGDALSLDGEVIGVG